MRNSTKQNHILKIFDIKLSKDKIICLTLIEKTTKEEIKYFGKTYGEVIDQAYKFYKQVWLPF